MDELKKTIERINADMRAISAILAARSRELDRREKFNEELTELINELKKK